jgi:hypothetical protein
MGSTGISDQRAWAAGDWVGVGMRAPDGLGLAVFAVEQVAHGAATGFVHFACSFAVAGSEVCGGCRVVFFGLTASGAAIGEAGFVGFEFELLGADGTDSDRERHNGSMVKESVWS